MTLLQHWTLAFAAINALIAIERAMQAQIKPANGVYLVFFLNVLACGLNLSVSFP